jgi:hypothetical protein
MTQPSRDRGQNAVDSYLIPNSLQLGWTYSPELEEWLIYGRWRDIDGAVECNWIAGSTVTWQ